MLINAQLEGVQPGRDGYSARYQHLVIIYSEGIELDGRRWLHVSCSRKDRTIPTYDDLVTLKTLTLGTDTEAYQVFPPAHRHIDIAGRGDRPIQVLHLWSCMTGPVLPDFTRGGKSI